LWADSEYPAPGVVGVKSRSDIETTRATGRTDKYSEALFRRIYERADPVCGPRWHGGFVIIMTRPVHRILRRIPCDRHGLFGLAYLARSTDVCRQSLARQREAELREDLVETCQAIHNYTLDREEAPQSLQDLVAAKYLREVPTDPITRKKDWVLVTRDLSRGIDQESVRIVAVRSASRNVGGTGVACKM
jgi:general secretion pathway protein G